METWMIVLIIIIILYASGKKKETVTKTVPDPITGDDVKIKSDKDSTTASSNGASVTIKDPPKDPDKNSKCNENSKCNLLTNGPYKFTMQKDGNLVLYKNNKAIWASNTNNNGKEGPYSLHVQGDGNLVARNGKGGAIWASNSNGNGVSPYSLFLQGDGNVVLRDLNSKTIWASGTNGK
jgi:hypothetical protein